MRLTQKITWTGTGKSIASRPRIQEALSITKASWVNVLWCNVTFWFSDDLLSLAWRTGFLGSWEASWPCACLLAALSVKECCTLSLRFLWGDVGFSWQAELQATQRNVSGSTALGGARRLHFQAKGNTASDSRPRLGRDCGAGWI